MLDLSMIDGFIVIPVVIFCFLAGYVIKNYTKIPNKNIPLIVMIIGIVTNIATSILDGCTVNFSTILSGGVSGLASSGAYELIVNMFKLKTKPSEDDTNNENTPE